MLIWVVIIAGSAVSALYLWFLVNLAKGLHYLKLEVAELQQSRERLYAHMNIQLDEVVTPLRDAQD